MTYEELEAENVRLHNQVGQLRSCLLTIQKQGLAIAEEVATELAYTGPHIGEPRA